MQVARIAKHLAEQEIGLEITDGAKDALAAEGFDTEFGARPLKRAIQDLVLDELALKMIKHEIKEGESVKIDAKKEKIVMTVA